MYSASWASVAEEFYALFRDELESRRIPYVPINGNGRARLDAAIRAVENLLSPYLSTQTRERSL
jgi:nicotinamide riboside kinase